MGAKDITMISLYLSLLERTKITQNFGTKLFVLSFQHFIQGMSFFSELAVAVLKALGCKANSKFQEEKQWNTRISSRDSMTSFSKKSLA